MHVLLVLVLSVLLPGALPVTAQEPYKIGAIFSITGVALRDAEGRAVEP
jgi:hypothetical protein